MTTYRIRLELESDATFGRGSGIPGLIDREIVLDRYGCPYLHGRTLKGLLSEVCSELLYALGVTDEKSDNIWLAAADTLFGRPGSTLDAQSQMRLGHAHLPEELHAAIRQAVIDREWTPENVTGSLTAVRHQTAMEAGGAPDPHTLRTARVILRRTVFYAEMRLPDTLTDHQRGLIAACVKGLRRAGLARNRGRGRLQASIVDESGKNLSDGWFQDYFQAEVVKQ